MSNYLNPKMSFRLMFDESFEAVCKRNGIEPLPETKVYISNLFAESLISNYMDAPNFVLIPFIFGLRIPKNEELLVETKKISNYVTIHLGYFPESLASNKFFSLEDYFKLGRYAYYNLHRNLPKNPAYEDLANHYPEIIFSINEAMDSIRRYDQKEIMTTYCCWEKTGHKLFKKKLYRLGFNTLELKE